MAPPSGLQTSTTATECTEEATLPPLARSATAPGPFRAVAAAAAEQQLQIQRRPDPSHLAPEDALFATSPPRRSNAFDPSLSGNGDLAARHLRMRNKDTGSRSRSRRRKRTWKKLLWVKQSCMSLGLLDVGMQGKSHGSKSADG